MGMIGFVGLGRMGRPMASNLTRKGFRLAVHDINRDAVEELELLQGGVAERGHRTSSIRPQSRSPRGLPRLQKSEVSGRGGG